jgi:predicted nucleic acid-binding protein
MVDLPIHHIDSNVLLGRKKKEVKQARKYMKFAGEKYLVRISLPALGECLMEAMVVEDRYYEKILNFIRGHFQNKLIEPVSVNNSHAHIDEIRSLDNRTTGIDHLIFACAIEDKANNFITTDKNLLENHKLEDKYDIKIRHPKDTPNFT